MHSCLRASPLIALVLLSFTPAFAFATEFVAAPELLGANDTLAWGQVGPLYSTIPNPVAVTTAAGQAVTVSQATGHGVASQADSSYGPMYAPGERLYLTDNGFGFSGGPLVFLFDHDVSGFGVVCDPNFYSQGFAGTIAAYDAADLLLGQFAFSVSATAQYKQVFAGVANDVANIHRVVIDGTFASDTPEGFAVGTVLLRADRLFADGFEITTNRSE